MVVRPETVLREVLSLGFRAHPRAVLHGATLAALTVALMWVEFPPLLLACWFAAYLLALAVRLRIGRAYFAREVTDAELPRWALRSQVSLAMTGLLWGSLGSVAIVAAPHSPLYALWTSFLIVLLGVLQAYTGAATPRGLFTFIACAMGPIVAASIALPSPHYWVRLAGEAALISIALRVGRSGSQYVEEAVRMRFENLELLREATAQKEALAKQKEELDRANVAKTRFLAAASHDLRQPMQALSLLVEGLQDRVHDPGARRIVDNVRTSVGALSSLLNEILDISRFDAGALTPSRHAFPVSRVLDRLRGPSSYLATQRYLTFRIRSSAVVVETDETLLYRILANFVDNALRYTEKGGVLVGCRRRAEGLRIEVWDTGIGVPAEELDAIFLEFHQVGNPQRDRQQGLGLGLAIVERAARLLGHRLDVRSRAGRGSVFSITVPYGDPARVVRTERAMAEPLDGCTVLVVEDDREIRDAMTLLLEGWKCRVATAASVDGVAEALRHLGAAPDMVIADYRLPDGRTGLDAIAEVRARHPGAAAVITTGDVSTDALRDMRAAGHPILHKPLRPARLRALLGAALRARNPMAAGERAGAAS